jgi:hypothetical protein
LRYKDVIMPELAIVAAWLCVMKMACGLDGEPRWATRWERAECRRDEMLDGPGVNTSTDFIKEVKNRNLKHTYLGARHHPLRQ